jgi:hypothetical protein
MVGCVASVMGAAWLAYHDKAGWGWFIFTAIFLGMITVSEKESGNPKVEED